MDKKTREVIEFEEGLKRDNKGEKFDAYIKLPFGIDPYKYEELKKANEANELLFLAPETEEDSE